MIIYLIIIILIILIIYLRIEFREYFCEDENRSDCHYDKNCSWNEMQSRCDSANTQHELLPFYNFPLVNIQYKETKNKHETQTNIKTDDSKGSSIEHHKKR